MCEGVSTFHLTFTHISRRQRMDSCFRKSQGRETRGHCEYMRSFPSPTKIENQPKCSECKEITIVFIVREAKIESMVIMKGVVREGEWEGVAEYKQMKHSLIDHDNGICIIYERQHQNTAWVYDRGAYAWFYFYFYSYVLMWQWLYIHIVIYNMYTKYVYIEICICTGIFVVFKLNEKVARTYKEERWEQYRSKSQRVKLTTNSFRN